MNGRDAAAIVAVIGMLITMLVAGVLIRHERLLTDEAQHSLAAYLDTLTTCRPGKWIGRCMQSDAQGCLEVRHVCHREPLVPRGNVNDMIDQVVKEQLEEYGQ